MSESTMSDSVLEALGAAKVPEMCSPRAVDRALATLAAEVERLRAGLTEIAAAGCEMYNEPPCWHDSPHPDEWCSSCRARNLLAVGAES